MRDLIFISNKFINPTICQEFSLPLEFIRFAQIKGKMYYHVRNQDTFVVQDFNRKYGNNVIYGAVFLLNNFEFYIRQLDAYFACSLSSLGVNHKLDTHHRLAVETTPISFSTVDQFERLLYSEDEPITCHAYLGNLNHPKIETRVKQEKTSHRIPHGIYIKHFNKLIREGI